ncbi:MAG: hypothetical protein HY690_18700 [Chloroflexi bacterium]|nr:hypothetical protein [Chloroflexota bacterium]
MRLLRVVDPGRAILALLLALGLWMVVQNEQNPEKAALTEFPVTVDVVDIPAGLTMVSDTPEVRLWVRAPENVWPRLKADSFKARVRATGAAGGVNDLRVQVDVFDSLVRTAEPRPDTVRLRLEGVRERSVPVKVNPTGNVPFGYSSAGPKVSPERLTVVGPESLVQRVDTAVVDIRMDGVTVSVSGSFTPRPIDGRGAEVKGVRLTPPQIGVEIPVNQEVSYKEVGIRPITRGRLAPGYYLLPPEVEPASATIVGHPAVLSGVSFLETEAVDVSDVSSSIVRRTKVQIPSGVSLLQPQLTALVTVRVQALEITQSVRLLPTIEGLGPDLVVGSQLPLIELAVSGPAPTLQGLNARDFKVTLNLAELGPGRHTVQPRVALPSSFKLERLAPQDVTVELRRVTPLTAQG